MRPLDQVPLFRELLDGLDHALCLTQIVCDADGRPIDYRFLDGNPAWEQQTGLVDTRGRTALEMVPTLEPFWIETYGRVGITGEPVRFEHRAEGLDGGWFEVYAYRIGDPAERLVAISFRNVKARKLADDERERLLQAVLAERRRLADVFELSPSFTAVLEGPEHRFLRCNAQYLALIGGRSTTGRTVAEVLPEAAAQGFVKLLDEVYRSGEPFVGRNVLFARQRGDGAPGFEDRYLDFVYQALRDEQGKTTGVFVQGVDVTERKLAEDALHEAAQRKDEFLATLAHELRNPLAPLMSSLAVLDRLADAAGLPLSAVAQQQGSDARQTLWRQLRQMVRLIDDLLDVSRITRGNIELRREKIALQTVLQQARETVEPAYETARQQLRLQMPEAPLWLHADPARLVQVLGNLLGNASRYSPPGTAVQVDVQQLDAATVGITVRDQGIGIPADRLETIFDMFVQVDPALPHAAAGLGIGLFLARRLTTLHGGQVRARSAGVGQGSEFVLQLPLSDAPARPAPAPSAVPGGNSPRRRVLIADDNVDAAQSMAMLLELFGHEVHTVSDGVQALDAAERLQPQVIVLDIGMPGLDGNQVCSRLRARPWAHAARIVALTGWGQDTDRRRSLAHGFDAHLVKPVPPEDLQALVEAPLAGTR